MMPPSTGLPQARGAYSEDSALTPLLDSIPEAEPDAGLNGAEPTMHQPAVEHGNQADHHG